MVGDSWNQPTTNINFFCRSLENIADQDQNPGYKKWHTKLNAMECGISCDQKDDQDSCDHDASHEATFGKLGKPISLRKSHGSNGPFFNQANPKEEGDDGIEEGPKVKDVPPVWDPVLFIEEKAGRCRANRGHVLCDVIQNKRSQKPGCQKFSFFDISNQGILFRKKRKTHKEPPSKNIEQRNSFLCTASNH